ncbi:hypothetical protein KCQ_03520 [Pectobacterium atrosepticum ICMP 1526]|nr:hypothetical protein KCQ_03520 [Pectobacterium atrosepticum ICMP 1526]
MQKYVVKNAHSGYRIDRAEKSSATLSTCDLHRTVDNVSGGYND